ncbi:PQQ-dependent sugar dehydrogenase [Amycolatopsis sp. CA-230715]|uniref:PQQ-dependent sugar dehydrogenase n=1 Tax=Amycolatopsis sp. CA-230715 TaxID=2745196 RepID=UPI003FA4B5D2
MTPAFAAAPEPAAVPAATDYEAEDAVITGGAVESNHPGFSGRGFVNYDNTKGSAVEWTVNVAAAGPADLAIRFANGTAADRPMDISVDGTVVSKALSFPGTGDWANWQSKTVKASLKAGANKVKAVATTANGGPNTDKLSVSGGTDTEPPTPPSNFAETDVQQTTIAVKWDASTDNVGVAKYVVENGGNPLKTVPGDTTTATLTELTPGTTYDLVVLAYDAAGNPSQASNRREVTTKPSNDKEPPSVPQHLATASVGFDSVSLTWDASTDNEKVAGYEVYQGGAKVASTTDTNAAISGLKPETEYTYAVKAKDVAGNLSAASAELKVKTAKDPGSSEPDYSTPIFDRQIAKLDLPWGIDFLPDKSALVAERDRFEIVRVTLDGQKTVLGKVPGAATTGGEGGVLGVAVSPNFATDHYVYVFHTTSGDNRIVRMKYENGKLGTTSEVVLSGIKRSHYHNGGRIRFGPDGKLYATAGNAEQPALGQDKKSLNGKILRINPDGSIPADNPFGNAVWSYGHRNPQGLAWDKKGQLWESELGDSDVDELNLIQKGKNYGYPDCPSGQSCVGPKQTWSTSSNSPSAIEIFGDYIYMAAMKGARLYVMKINDAGDDVGPSKAFFNGQWGRLRTIVKTPDGGAWLSSTNDDKNGGSPSSLDNVIVRLKFSGGGSSGPGEFKLTSPAFQDNATIPDKYTCAGDGKAGQDPSPPLAWGTGGDAAESYAIVFADKANNGTKLHWAIWDIPASALTLPEGLGAGYTVPGQGGAKQKAMGSGATAQQFFGPCPGGSSHPYAFTLYAVKTATVPGLSPSSSMAQIETAIKNGSSANTVLHGKSSAAQ